MCVRYFGYRYTIFPGPVRSWGHFSHFPEAVTSWLLVGSECPDTKIISTGSNSFISEVSDPRGYRYRVANLGRSWENLKKSRKSHTDHLHHPNMGSFVRDSSPVPWTCLGPGNHSFAFGAPSPAGKELVGTPWETPRGSFPTDFGIAA